jgi:hypothetical protein
LCAVAALVGLQPHALFAICVLILPPFVRRLYLTLRQRRREGYGTVEATVEHVSRGGLNERLFFVLGLILLSHVGLLVSPLTWAFFLAWRWSEFVMILVVLWAHRKQIKLGPVGLRNQVMLPLLPLLLH